MRFYDKVDIEVISGRGGSGMATGRREKYEPHGGPSGGDGGDGGDIILKATKNQNTLSDYKYQKKFKADSGAHGEGSSKNGQNGQNEILEVPVGTIVRNKTTGKVIAQLMNEGQELVVVEGGKGGLGNTHFKNPTRQYPTFYLLGEPSQKKELILELQLLGDVALIGTPSAGKSTLINSVSNVKAKTADYHFTTLVPNIGVVDYKNYSRTMVDIPGLIEGAGQGKGLGNEFLRHILKARLFVFMIDISKYEESFEEIGKLFDEILNYIKKRFFQQERLDYNEEDIFFELKVENNNIVFETYLNDVNEKTLLLRKLIYVVLNKYDILDDQELMSEYQGYLFDKLLSYFKENFETEISREILEINSSVISAITRYGVDDFLDTVGKKIHYFDSKDILDIKQYESQEEKESYIKDITEEELYFLVQEGYVEESMSKYIKVWEVSDKYVSYLTYVTPWSNNEAELWFWSQLRKKGYLTMFNSKGAQKGDVLKIKSFYNTEEDRYLLYE